MRNSGYLTPLGGPKVCYTDLTILWYSYTRVYEHTKRAQAQVCSNYSGTLTSTSTGLIFVC